VNYLGQWIFGGATQLPDGNSKLTLYTSSSAGTGLTIYEQTTGNNARLRLSQTAGAVVYDATYSSGANSHVFQIGSSTFASIDQTRLSVQSGEVLVSGSGSRGVRLRGVGNGEVAIAGDGTTYATSLAFYNTTSYATLLGGMFVYAAGGAFQYLSIGSAYNSAGIYINSSNNVGINNSNPSGLLDVLGTTATTMTTYLRGGTYSNVAYANGFRFSTPSGGSSNPNRQLLFSSLASVATIQGIDGAGNSANDTTLAIHPSGGYVTVGTNSIGLSAAFTVSNLGNASTNPAAYFGGATSTVSGALGGTIVIRDTTSSASPATAGFAGIAFTSSPGTDYTIGKYWGGSGTSGFVIKNAASSGYGDPYLFIEPGNGNVGFNVAVDNATLPRAKINAYQASQYATTAFSGPGGSQGNPIWITVVKQVSVVSTGTQLIIPIINQGSYNLNTIVRVRGVSAQYNTNIPRAFTAEFAFGHLGAIYNLSSWGLTGVSSVTASSMNIVIALSGGPYTSTTSNGVFMVLEYLTSFPTLSIDVPNIAMN
jgi:hypothetical protein